MDESLVVLMLTVVSRVSLYLQLQDHLNQGTFFSVHLRALKGWVTHFFGIS